MGMESLQVVVRLRRLFVLISCTKHWPLFLPLSRSFSRIVCFALSSCDIGLLNLIWLQFSSPERLPSPDHHLDHLSDASLHSAQSSDSEDCFKAKRKQHYRMGAALKGQAPMGM
jgi:hypothetical protein